jgi:hypothetical protein
MATSFIQLGPRGFWCHDELLERLAALLAERLARRSGTAWAAYAKHLSVQATAGMTGCIDLGLDSLSDTARVELLATLMQLRDREGEGDELVRLVDVLQRLLTREWPWSVGDAEALPRAWLFG